jgi:hypothetical protein
MSIYLQKTVNFRLKSAGGAQAVLPSPLLGGGAGGEGGS